MTDRAFERVASIDDLAEGAPITVQAGGRSMGLFRHDGRVYATDNRCPHMGFPLTDGSVDEGLLTCPWHHARFELSSGDTLDPFADDVQTYPVEVREGDVYVSPEPRGAVSPETHWRQRLEHGLREGIDLVIAKAVIGLDDAGVDPAIPVRIGVEFGTAYRGDGWGSGLTTLGVMTNLLPDLRPGDRRRALFVGLTAVADDSAGEPPFFAQEPLDTDAVGRDRLAAWFRDTVDVRDADGGERVLRTAIRRGADPDDLAGMIAAAGTDHVFLDTGHMLDFANKAFEVLDRVGWEHADAVLPSLVPGLAAADRAEESSSWRQPIDVADLRFEAADRLESLLEASEGETWVEPDGFVEVLLGDDPAAILDALADAVAAGATAAELAGVVAYAAARRIAQFGTSNQFFDWNTVHHTYSHANAVDGLARRTSDPAVYRGVFDTAIRVYLDRFLNVPPTPLPDPDGEPDPDGALEALERTFEVESDETVTDAGNHVADYLAAGGDVDRLKHVLGGALLREDVGFHPRQNLEAAFAQHARQHGGDRGRIHLIAAARYLAAHTPTRRSGEQTYRIADRLHRGERIHEA